MIVDRIANLIESEEEKNEFKDAGFDSIITKHITENEFVKFIEKSCCANKKRHSSKKI